MRLSDAMALGRTLIGFQKYTLLSEDGTKGCAFGAALKSIGHIGGSRGPEHNVSLYVRITDEWPWLSGEQGYLEDIFSRFDSMVMNGKMTFDELIDYVRSVEPAEGNSVDTTPVEEVEYASVT